MGLLLLFGGVGTPAAADVAFLYTNLEPSYDLDQVFNKWVGTREGGTPQIWEDLASQEDNFLRAKQVTSLVTSDGEVLNQMQWKSGQFSQPLNRVESIEIVPLRDRDDTAQIDASLAREIGDRITVNETPPGFATMQSGDYIIQQLSGQINIGPVTTMRLRFLLWPASVSSFWIVGDAALSLAGVTTKPGY